MGSTRRLHTSEALDVVDNTGKVRTNFLKRYLPGTMDAIRFYHFTGTLAQLPVVGRFVKKGLHLYYRYLHTNSLVFPLREMEAVIETATDLYVDPCPCRAVAEEKSCDAPLYTCLRINHTASLRKEMKGGKSLSRADALAILRNAYDKGLVLSLESCIQPYQNNICMCCTCCCIAMKMRYEYGVPIYHSGPYLPVCDSAACTGCASCSSACPVGALEVSDSGVRVDPDRCLGCGHCASACPSGCLEMAFTPHRVRQDREPGPMRLALSLVYIHAVMVPSVLLFRLVAGSKQHLMEQASPNASDVFEPSMQQK